jgi:transcriptional regulator with XRE-family HTH domain
MDDSPDDLLSLVGTTIKERRLELGLSQGEFARRAGFVKQYANRVEAGQQNLNLRSLHRIATALETTMAALVANAPPQKD